MDNLPAVSFFTFGLGPKRHIFFQDNCIFAEIEESGAFFDTQHSGGNDGGNDFYVGERGGSKGQVPS